jgi:GntR family carbon starvation induced transcriptional regulator
MVSIIGMDKYHRRLESEVNTMNGRRKGMSQTRQVFERLRTAIVGGRLLPDSKLNIAALAEDIAVSAGAVREALAMLEAEALVVSEPARGYRVSPVSAVELQDLVKARIEVEKLCLAEAIRHGDLAWEGAIVSAFHRLTRVAERDAKQPKQLSEAWAAVHADFHRALVSGCPNQWLLRLHDMLYQQSERYRQLSAPLAAQDRDVLSEHQAIVDAVLNRDIQAAQERIAEHLQATARLLLASPRLALHAA